MKTLKEVIKALEICTSDRGGCEGCPYDPDCKPDKKWDEALHYLKEYQMLQIAYLKAMADLEDNPPLTWDELKEMGGEPVWVEEKDMPSTWIIIWDVTENWLYPTGCDAYRHEEYGKSWQAYRKERK